MNTKQKLVTGYMALANKLAYQKKKSLPNHIDIEDLKSAAYLGLTEAAHRYEPEFGISFSTYAYPRIFGAIQDFLRELNCIKYSKDYNLVSLSLANEEGNSLAETIESKPEENIEEIFEVLTFNIEGQAKTMLKHYFIDELSMREVGEKFNVSESRISQLIKQYKEQIHFNWNEYNGVEGLAA